MSLIREIVLKYLCEYTIINFPFILRNVLEEYITKTEIYGSKTNMATKRIRYKNPLNITMLVN